MQNITRDSCRFIANHTEILNRKTYLFQGNIFVNKDGGEISPVFFIDAMLYKRLAQSQSIDILVLFSTEVCYSYKNLY